MSIASEQDNHPKEVSPTKKTWWQKLPVYIFRGFMLLVGLFLLVFLLFQIPAFQNFVANKITTRLSEAWDTRVELDRVQLEFFDQLVLEGFYVEDQQQDTLIYAEQLKVNLNTGIIPLIMRRLEIDEISLRNASINVYRLSGSEEQNLQFLLDRLAGKPDEDASFSEEEPKPFYLGIERVFLENVSFSKLDSLYGSDQHFVLSRMECEFEEFDLVNKRLELRSLEVENPVVDIHLFPWDSLMLNEIYVRDSLVELYRWPPDLPNSDRYLVPPWEFISYSDLSFMAWSLEWPPMDSLMPPPPEEEKLTIAARSFDLMGGTFSFHNHRRSEERRELENVLDFNNLELSEIYGNIRNFLWRNGSYRGDVRRIAFDSDAGFVVKKLASSDAYIDSKGVRLEDLVLETPYSQIGDRVVLKYDEFTDFKDFVNAVELDSVSVRSAFVAVRDIMAFAPALEENIYFQQNRDKVLQIDGDFFGTVDNLSGSTLRVVLDQNTYINGEFSFFNLTYPENQYLNLQLDQSRITLATLRQLLPNFNPPENFNKLGTIDFSGRFDGFFYDFVADGELRSDIGSAFLDMQLNTIGGREQADYSGNISLIGFDLGAWTENDNLGKVTMNSTVRDGKGLTASTAEATLEANIDSLFIRGYNYQNLNMEGKLQQNLFNGSFNIQEENIDLTFEGTIDFTERRPLIDFDAQIRELDLRQLNLVKEDYSIAGNIDLNIRDIDLSNMEGSAMVSNLVIGHGREDRYIVDSIALVSVIHSENDRELIVESDLLSGHLDGDFDINQIPGQFLQFSWRHFPKFSDQLNVPQSDRLLDSTSNFDYNFYIRDTKGLMNLIDPKLEELSDINIEGRFDIPAESFKLDLEASELQYGTVSFDDVVVVVKAREGGSDLNFAVSETTVGEDLTFAPINLLGLVDQDTLFFGVTAYDFTEVLNTVEVDGKFFPVEEDFIVRFEESDVILFNELWQIDADNFLRIGDDYIRTRDFVLRNGNRKVVLESIGNRGLLLQLQNYDLDGLNEIASYEPTQFSGILQVQATIKDVFNFSDLEVRAESDSLFINGDDFGTLRVDLNATNLKSRVTAKIAAVRSGQVLELEGYYNPPGYTGATNKDLENYLNVDAVIRNIPLAILEYWVGAGISNTEGIIIADANVKGKPDLLEIDGVATVNDAKVTVNYLNTSYSIDGQKLLLTNGLFDATGVVLRDEDNNPATLSGGILHNHLKDLELAVTLTTDRFLGLNTQKGQNDLFYGTAYAQGKINFNGPFNRTDIYVNATSLTGTAITLPVDYGRDAGEVQFIRFKDKREQQLEEEVSEEDQLGVSIILDLNVKENVEMRIVFDEQLGDILTGKGNGNLRLVATRDSDFQLIGNYTVAQGDYLFTLMNIGLNKPFKVLPGGTIKWTGDPFGAEIDLTASYEGLQAKLNNFIQEYLLTASETTQQQADDPVDVDLTMILTGQLLNPDIDFDINFPNLTGELKSYAENKLRIIRQEQNEMNRQVFGLIVVGQFLPSDFSLTGNEFNIGFNTVTEMIFQQFSNYLTGLVSEWLREDGLITGIDFDINYNTLQDAEAIADNPILYYQSGELEFRLSNYLLDDRLSVNVGGNFDLGGNDFVDAGGTQGAYFAGDIVIEYVLTEDRDLKIRFYQSTEPDLSGERLNKTGIGLSYRKQFDSFSGFIEGLRGATKKMGKKRKKDDEEDEGN